MSPEEIREINFCCRKNILCFRKQKRSKDGLQLRATVVRFQLRATDGDKQLTHHQLLLTESALN